MTNRAMERAEEIVARRQYLDRGELRDSIAAALIAARREGMEECKAVADSGALRLRNSSSYREGWDDACDDISKDIQALIDRERT